MEYNNSDMYWAAKADPEFLLELHKRNENYYRDLEQTKLYYVWERSFMAYYGSQLSSHNMSGQLFDSAEIGRTGSNSQITNLKTNHYRNLIQHALQLSTSDRPAWNCQATNTDYKSQAQCILGRGILDYYYREKNFQKYYKQAMENALVFSEGWIHAPWNETSGEIIAADPETGMELHEGDFIFSAHTPLDIVRDISLRNEEQHDWLMVKTYENKYNLAAKYPAYAEEIIRETDSYSTKFAITESFELRIRRGSKVPTDRIPLWTFYHRPTESLPHGRMAVVTANTVLFSGPMPYEKIPLYAIFPENLIGTPYGYTPAFDLLGPQQGIDILTATAMTNNAANGVQNIWTRKGDDLSSTDLGGGLKHLSSDEPPQALQLTKTAPETFSFRRELIGEMETLMGISATVRGNPEASLKSGAALALMVSQSVQFASMLEMSASTMLCEFGTALINNLKAFAKSNRVVTIMGESARPYQKQFTGEDLSGVSRVTVEQVSAVSKTTAGRLQIAQDLLEKGLISDPKQYIMVLSTGKLDPVTEDTESELLNIRAENEALRRGEQVQVIISENHAQHYKAHSAMLNHEAKKDPEFVARVLQHMADHLEQWNNMSPAVAQITNQALSPVAGQSSAPVMGPEQEGAQSNSLPNLPSMPNMPSLPQGAPIESQVAYDKFLMDQQV